MNKWSEIKNKMISLYTDEVVKGVGITIVTILHLSYKHFIDPTSFPLDVVCQDLQLEFDHP